MEYALSKLYHIALTIIAFTALIGSLAGCFSIQEMDSVSTPTPSSAIPTPTATSAVPTRPSLHAELATSLVPAFPGAEGAGAQTPGGRRGRVIEVTTLSDDGPGSLRDALDARGPRIVVFRVGGVIELKRPLLIREPYLTIAGQTAPGDGILLKGTDASRNKMLVLKDVHDVIIRYLRVRGGAHGEPGRGQINISIDSGVHDVIIDHTSLSWSLDENLSIHRNIPPGADPVSWPPIYNITVQRSLLAEGLYPHSTGMQIGGEADLDGWQGVYNLSLHHNLMAHNSHRNPGLGSSGVQVINNVIYNWGTKASETHRGSRVDVIGNYYKPGSLSDPRRLWVHNAFPKGQPQLRYPDPSLYVAGNVAPPYFSAAEAENRAMFRIHYAETPLPSHFLRATPLPPPPLAVTITAATEAYEAVLADVGANARLDCAGRWVANGDAVDARLLADVRQGRPQRPGGQTTHASHEAEVGGYPPMQAAEACQDTDHDGMPDAWEIARGVLNPNADDSDGHDLDRHYTNIEVYLNGQGSSQIVGILDGLRSHD